MLNLLHVMPDPAILAVVAFCFVGLLLVAPVAARAAGLRPDAKRAENAFEAYKTITSILGILLAFSLVQVNTNLRNAEAMVGREASAITDLDRTLSRFGTAETTRIRAMLAEYSRTIVTDEWPALAEGGRSLAVDRIYRGMDRDSLAIKPATPQQLSMFTPMLKYLDDLADLRETRIIIAGLALPPVFWDAVLVLAGLMLVLAGLVDREAGGRLTIEMGGIAIALLLALVIIIDGPFKGESSVSPEPIQKAIARNAERY